MVNYKPPVVRRDEFTHVSNVGPIRRFQAERGQGFAGGWSM